MSSLETTEYRTATVSVRPSRTAVGYTADPVWIDTARRALASMSVVWGGSGAVLIPVDQQGRCDDVLMPHLRNYDPDYAHRHVRTWNDYARLKPDLFAAQAAKCQSEDEDLEQAKARLLASIGDKACDEGASWERFAAQISTWCAPHVLAFVAGSGKFLENHLGITNADHLASVRDGLMPTPQGVCLCFDVEGIPGELALMLETRTGQIPAVAEEAGWKAVRLPVKEEDYKHLAAYLINGVMPAFYKIADRWGETDHGKVFPNTYLSTDELNIRTPFALTQQWCGEMRTFHGVKGGVLVAGDDPTDHSLSMLCDRVYGSGCWLPPKITDADDALGAAFKSAIADLWSRRTVRAGFNSDDDKLYLTSASLTKEQLTAIAERWKPVYAQLETGASSDSWIEIVTPEELSRTLNRRWLADKYFGSSTVSVHMRVSDGTAEMLTPFAAPVPQARNEVGEQLLWQTDLMLHNHQLPQLVGPPLSLVSADKPGGFPEANIRIGLLGLTYSSEKAGIASYGGNPELAVARPRLRFASAGELFAEAARRQNATVRPSIAGRRASLAMQKWGSLEDLTSALRGSMRTLLDSFNTSKTQGDYGAGFSVGGTGYVSLTYANGTVGDEARDLLDDLIRRQLVRRGFILSCDRCRKRSFVPIAHIDDHFECPSCGSRNLLTSGQWDSRVSEPEWFYDLDPVMRDLLNDNGDIPMLAIEKLRAGATSVLYCPELEIIFGENSRPNVETDICVIIDGRIITGEAKSTNQPAESTKKAANKIVKAAEVLGAERIILATTKKAWAPGFAAAAAESRDKSLQNFWRPAPTIDELLDLSNR